jgi:hypothetical protein
MVHSELCRFSSAENTQRGRDPAPPRSLSVTRSRQAEYIFYIHTHFYHLPFSLYIMCSRVRSAGLPRRPLDQHFMYSFSFTLTSMSGCLSAERLNSQFTDGALSLYPRNKSTGLTRATLQIRWTSCTQKGCTWQGHKQKQTLHHHTYSCQKLCHYSQY